MALLLSQCFYLGTPNTESPRRRGKYHPVAGTAQPLSQPREFDLECQIEGHTCGMHALSTIYRGYGLDPERQELRFRLGVDRRGNPLDPSSQGSLQPDILRVVHQDGFQTHLVDLQELPAASDEIKRHLAQGHCVLTLIRRRQNGNLHWVVMQGIEQEEVRVYDSLAEKPYGEPLPDFLVNHILSAVLITPGNGDVPSNIWRDHLRGIKEMHKTQRRMKETKQQ